MRFFRPLDQDESDIPPIKERNYEAPVAWLLGRQLINSFKGWLIYGALGNKIDARDWMAAEVIEFPDASESGEFWFDYLSDTGDGMMAVYSLAYLSMSDLWATELLTRMPPRGADSGAGEVRLDEGESFKVKLPRGEFLFVGGDTAYHASDYSTLASRFQTPFRWAFKDRFIGENPLQEGERKKERKVERHIFTRALFGIPGNHDYYDQLDGFRRQFRAPVRAEGDGKLYAAASDPQLSIPDHCRRQKASYLALKLPFGWWLWGLDTEVGEVDERQKKFFREIKIKDGRSIEEGARPDKLIVATCAPTTVFGKRADGEHDTRSARAFYQLGLPRPFLTDAETEGEPTLGDDEIRLDLSGDIHLYARYWGPPSGENPRARGSAPQPQAENYASVVSGLGGAFHHPTQTYAGDVREQVLYPSENKSREEVAKQIFHPLNLWNGNGVWLVGFIAAFLIYFAVTVAPSSRDAVNNFYLDNFLVRDFKVMQGLGLGQATKVCPTIPAIEPPRETRPFPLWPTLFGNVPSVRPPFAETRRPACDLLPDCPVANGLPQPAYFWGPCAVETTPFDYKLGVALALLTLAPIILGAVKREWFFGWLFKDPDLEKVGTTWRATRDTDTGTRRWFQERPFLKVLFILALPLMSLAALSVLTIRPYRAHITPFGSSMFVLLSFVWAAAAISLNLRYGDWLFHKTMARKLSSMDWLMTWIVLIYAALAVTLGVWFYGRNNQMAYVLLDILLVIIVPLIIVGLTLLGYYGAGNMQKGFWRRLPYAALGFAHGLLQMAIPFVLVRRGLRGEAVPQVFAMIASFALIGWQLMKRNQRGWLALAGLVYGALMLFLPVWAPWMFAGPDAAVAGSAGMLPFLDRVTFEGFHLWILWLLPSVSSGMIAAILSCVWLGWYFAISLSFNGHNNEAGGAARIERFKEFIRFRLARDRATGEDTLTGYVIAIDDPQKDGRDLRPRLIDVFHLRAKQRAPQMAERMAEPTAGGIS
jgi:hypothetical protein